MSNHDTVAMILAAGEGRRMRPLTHHCPKPLLPFRGRPLIDQIAEKLQALSLRAIGVNTHHLASTLEDWLHEHHPTFVLHREEKLLGSGGGVRAMDARLPASEHFLYHNGDILTDAPLDALLKHHRETHAELTMLLMPSAAADGNLRFEPSTGRITQLPLHEGFAHAPTHANTQSVSFAGIMVFRRALIQRLPANHPSPCILRDALSSLLLEGANVQGLYHSGLCSDLGTHERWLQTLRQFEAPPFDDEIVPQLPQAIEIEAKGMRLRFRPPTK